MNKERYNQIIDSTYKSYLRKAKNQTTEDLFGSMIKGDEIIHGMLESHTRDFIPYTREEFINKIKTDKEFSERCGLEIEERELSLVEMIRLAKYENEEEIIKTRKENINQISERLLKDNIPPRAISLIYKGEKLEIYE
jgi:hypothetical protein